MRYINRRLIGDNLPKGWLERAQEAADAVMGAQPQDRPAEVDRYSEVWRDLKATLKRASHEKCWYCESIEIRSDNAVDHFRPKNAVAECPCPGKEGYWWLAFEWENYRFSCTFCNSRRVDQATGSDGGKSHHFPLRDEGRRAHTPADDLGNEEPLLLDPFVPADPGFLWFDESGHASPHPICNGPNGYPYKRADASIQLYHLNHPGVVDQRKALCAEIRRRVQEADRYFAKYHDEDGTARTAFEDAIVDLKGKLVETAEYSAAARAMLMGLRGTHPFVDVVLAST